MANREQLEQLLRSTKDWNTWRRKHREIVPDLREANLRGADLTYADLKGANLSQADLKDADLKDADLRDAIFSNANLSRADLNRADLSETDLSNADLSIAIFRDALLDRADLRGANLHAVHLTNAYLNGADLRGANFSEVNFRGANFSRANLNGADLRGADLNEVNFSEADLSRACLHKAFLSHIDLSGADLSGADLSGATLYGTDLSGATLTTTDMTNAKVGGTHFADIDLRTVKGLETIEHEYQSNISITTLYRSAGQIPDSFLRQAGVPEDFLLYLPSLVNRAIEYYTCFISYSSKDQEFVERLYADLQSKGVRCWFAPEDLKTGDKIRDRIDQSIRLHDKLLLVLSEHSVNSSWVEFEVEAAIAKENSKNTLMLFPIRLDSAVKDSQTSWAAHIRRTRNITDFTNWKQHDAYQKVLNRLLRDLKPEKPPGATQE